MAKLEAHPSTKTTSCGISTEVVVSTNPNAAAGSLITALPDDKTRVSVETDATHKNPAPADANGEVTFKLLCQSGNCPSVSKVVFHLPGYDDAACTVTCEKKASSSISRLTPGEGEIFIAINPSLITERVLSLRKAESTDLAALEAPAESRRPELVTSRPYLGIALAEGKQRETIINDLLGNAPAAGQIQLGDVVKKMGEVEITGLTSMSAVLSQLKVGKEFPIALDRGRQHLTVRVVPGLLFAGKGDINGPSKSGVKCDNNCHCTERARATCQEQWFFVGPGKNGGVLYHKICTALDPDTFEVVNQGDCGNKEYF